MPKTRNILLVSEYFHPHWTGIAQSFYVLAKNLQSQGHRVHVLTTQFDTALPLQETIDGLPVTRSPYQVRLSRTHYSLTIIWDFLKMIPRFDTVIINSPNSNILFYSILTKLFSKSLVIYHQGDLILPRLTGNQIANRLIERVFDALTIPSMLMANVISTFTRDYAEHSRVMSHHLEAFRPYIPAHPIGDWAMPKGRTKRIISPRIGFAGRFVEEKAYDVLLKAIPLVVKKYPKVVFVFAGQKKIDYEPYAQLLEKEMRKLKKHLVFLGLLDMKGLEKFYATLSAFVISSRSDCFTLTQIEAARKGVPIVVTDIPGARMLVKKSGFGATARVEDPEALAEAILHVLDNHEKIMKNHNKALAYLKKYENFNIE